MPTVKQPDTDARAVEHGQLIKERRLDLGLNRPAFVAQMGKHGQDITPDYLNKLERGTAALSRASLEVREAIRAVLGYSAEEWHELTGLYAPTPTSKPFPAAPFAQTGELYLPEGLKDAIEKFGDDPEYSALRDPAVARQVALARGFDGGPETAGEWLAFYLSNKRWIDGKRGN